MVVVVSPLSPFRAIEVFTRWQLGKSVEMLRAQRFRNTVLFSKPLAQIDQLAAVRTKRAVDSVKPVTHLFAGWTLDLARWCHDWLPPCYRRNSQAMKVKMALA